MKTLILLKGLPGSGKSYLAKQLAEDTGKIFSTDDFFYDSEGKYNFDHTKLGQYHADNKLRTELAMIDNEPKIVVDNTNLTTWEMQPYIDLAKKYEYKVEFHEPKTPWKFDPVELAKRNSHGVPLNTIESMLKRYEPFPKLDC